MGLQLRQCLAGTNSKKTLLTSLSKEKRKERLIHLDLDIVDQISCCHSRAKG